MRSRDGAYLELGDVQLGGGAAGGAQPQRPVAQRRRVEPHVRRAGSTSGPDETRALGEVSGGGGFESYRFRFKKPVLQLFQLGTGSVCTEADASGAHNFERGKAIWKRWGRAHLKLKM